MSKYLAITVDVEAQPKRAAADHFERLILGRFPDGQQEVGAIRIADIVAGMNGQATFFVDFPEEHLYPGHILDVAGRLHARGHEIGLHAHPELYPQSFWDEHDLPRQRQFERMDESHIRTILNDLQNQCQAAIGQNARSFRGGGYRFGSTLLRLMPEYGLRISSNYNPEKRSQGHDGTIRSAFEWDCGILELPISAVRRNGTVCPFNFNSARFRTLDRMLGFFRDLEKDHPTLTACVFVMHSWSLCHEGEDGLFSYGGDKPLRRFEKFLKKLAKNGWKFVSTTTWAEMVKHHDEPLTTLDPRAILSHIETATQQQ